MNWKPIPGYEGLYEISDTGLINNLRKYPRLDGDFMKQSIVSYGRYKQICLTNNEKLRRFHYVHRLVATAFIPNPLNKAEVNHINGDRFDNRSSNLEWATRKENVQHSIKLGLRR